MGTIFYEYIIPPYNYKVKAREFIMEEKLVIRVNDERLIEKIRELRMSGVNLTELICEFLECLATEEDAA